MYEQFLDALKDSLRMVPFLLIIYFMIEWLESRFGARIQQDIQKAGKAGPLVGALFGCIPQCGFSVIGSALYSRRLITTGTLLAVFLSTSDEAVPVILAQHPRMGVIGAILLTKIVIAILTGYLIDLLWRRSSPAPAKVIVEDPVAVGAATAVAAHDHHLSHEDHVHEEPDDDIHVDACCGHHVAETNRSQKHWLHPLRHTAQVFLFVFIVTFGINMLVYSLGEQGLSRYLLGGTVWQPVVTALIGMIPNCAASVAITEMYLQNGISFGAAIAGLCSSAGLGILVLMKENHNLKDTLRIFGLLLGISMAVGILLQCLSPVLSAIFC